MINKFKPISISLSPNVQKDDVRLALKLLFQPGKWKEGSAIKELEESFRKYLGVNPVRNSPPTGPSGAQSAGEISNGVKYAVSFNSGRSALFAILKALNLPLGSNVSLQAFTCNAVPNPILWAGLNPVYIDCKDDFNIDPEKVTGEIVIIQHTFGLPANIENIMSRLQRNQGSLINSENLSGRQTNTVIIEDCAHALGAEVNSQKVGTFGKAGFFSFSRDKVISSVYGGMAVTNDDAIGKRLEELQKEFGMPGMFWIKQQILHPILLHYIILPMYNFLDLGKIFLILSQSLHVLSKAVSWQEKRGLRPDYFPKALPNAMAMMALHQFNKLEKFNSHRKELADFYYQELQNTSFVLPKKENNIFLRFAVQHPKAHEIIYEAWHKENMLLGDWYTSAIAPDDTKMEEMKYEAGMCPNAERLAKQTLNLPTHINISKEEAQRIVNFLKKYK